MRHFTIRKITDQEKGNFQEMLNIERFRDEFDVIFENPVMGDWVITTEQIIFKSKHIEDRELIKREYRLITERIKGEGQEGIEEEKVEVLSWWLSERQQEIKKEQKTET